MSTSWPVVCTGDSTAANARVEKMLRQQITGYETATGTDESAHFSPPSNRCVLTNARNERRHAPRLKADPILVAVATSCQKKLMARMELGGTGHRLAAGGDEQAVPLLAVRSTPSAHVS